MSTAKSVLGIPLLALVILLIIMVVGFIIPVDAQPHLVGTIPTVASPTDVPESTPTSTPVSPANTQGSVTTSRSFASSSTEIQIPVLPLSGAGQPAGLLLPAILVLAAVLSCIYVTVTRSVQRAS